MTRSPSAAPSLGTEVAKLAGQRILVMGDLMLDRFVYGAVNRISPEAPIPVLAVSREAAMLGGAGNVARNLIDLGAEVDLIGLLGNDGAGHQITRMIGEMPRMVPHLITDPDRPTIQKTRYVADGQQMLRADREVTTPISALRAEDVIRRFGFALPSVSAVILSDYAKGLLTDQIVEAAIAIGSQMHKPVIVDPKGRDYRRYRGAWLITPNRKELAEATGLTLDTHAAVEQAARQIIESCGIDNVLCTLASDGMYLFTKAGERGLHLPATAREVFDVSGAGDTVVATLAAGISAGLSLAVAAEIANEAAAIVIGKHGTATTTLAELTHALTDNAAHEQTAKILTREEAVAQAAAWRTQGKKVGFTNGCFDLLHPGHISLVRQARAACDKLIVGLNTDASVRRLKGETRPVQSELARATVLSSLADVDAVVLFDEDTPYDLIKAVQPAVLVKGADYTVETVVGADLVQGWGGRVVLAKLEAGFSTTSTIAKLRA